MKSTRIAAATALLAVTLLAGACGGKEPTGPTISLSLEEVSTLAEELGSVMNTFTVANLRTGTGPLFSIVGVGAAVPINATASCPGGGTASVAGSYDGTTTVTADVTFTYNGCKTAHFTTGGSFRVTGNGTSTATTATAQATASGTMNVSTVDGRSGACVIDFTINAGMTQTTAPVFAASGTACGAKVTGSY